MKKYILISIAISVLVIAAFYVYSGPDMDVLPSQSSRDGFCCNGNSCHPKVKSLFNDNCSAVWDGLVILEQDYKEYYYRSFQKKAWTLTYTDLANNSRYYKVFPTEFWCNLARDYLSGKKADPDMSEQERDFLVSSTGKLSSCREID